MISAPPTRGLFVMPHLCFGGAERLASRIVAELSERGCAITVIVVGRKPEEADATEAWFAPVADEIIRLDADPSAVLAGISSQIASCTPSFVALVGRSAGFYALPGLRHRFPSLRFISFQFNERELTLEHRLYGGFLDLIVVEGTVVAGHLIRQGVEEDRIAIIPSGIDLRAFAPRDELSNDPPLSPVVGFVGRMDPIKGPLDFVAICAHLASRPVRFAMAGDGPSGIEVRRAIWKRGLERRIDWQGRIAQAELPEFYARLAVLVVPSTLDGRPLVVQEAQACGVPVVASRVGSIPDLIEDGATGLLCPPSDHAAFAGAVGKLLDDQGLRRRIGAAGQDRVLREGGLAAALPAYAFALLGGT
jgi:glycosyltransferase involved in cell wall biosynthesis